MAELNSILADFYERDIGRLIDELNSFENEENLWKTAGSVKNSVGNLALHIIGGLNYLVGTTLANTGYVRKRDQEFTQKDVPRKEIVAQLEKLVPLIRATLAHVDMEKQFPIFFDKPNTSNAHVLTQLALHLNYHLGQANYLRRILEM